MAEAVLGPVWTRESRVMPPRYYPVHPLPDLLRPLGYLIYEIGHVIDYGWDAYRWQVRLSPRHTHPGRLLSVSGLSMDSWVLHLTLGGVKRMFSFHTRRGFRLEYHFHQRRTIFRSHTLPRHGGGLRGGIRGWKRNEIGEEWWERWKTVSK